MWVDRNQTACQSVQPFLQYLSALRAHGPRHAVCSNTPHYIMIVLSNFHSQRQRTVGYVRKLPSFWRARAWPWIDFPRFTGSTGGSVYSHVRPRARSVSSRPTARHTSPAVGLHAVGRQVVLRQALFRQPSNLLPWHDLHFAARNFFRNNVASYRHSAISCTRFRLSALARLP